MVRHARRARWLCDLSLTAEERVARIAADELHGKKEVAKMVKEYGGVTEGVGLLRDALAAAALVPVPRPTSTSVVGQVLGNEPEAVRAMQLTYRHLSARPHMSSHVLFSAEGHFSGVVDAIRYAATVWLVSSFEFHQYIGWSDLPKWVSWANTVKPRL